jgi:hypothetical protein
MNFNPRARASARLCHRVPPPSAKELSADAIWQADHGCVVPYYIMLAARVEKVIALRGAGTVHPDRDCYGSGYNAALDTVLRLLNGEE